MSRYLLFAIALVSVAQAQEMSPVLPSQSRNTGIIRSYKFNTSGSPSPWYPTTPTLEVDFSQSPPGAGATFVANTGQTLTVVGTPVKVTDGTWPAGTGGSQGTAWKFDGSTTYITSSIAPPAGDFSVMCVVTPSALTADATIISNFLAAGNKRGWRINQISSGVYFAISDDGTSGAGHETSINVLSSLAIGRQSIIVASYDYVTDGSSKMRLYVDELAAGSSDIADGPVYSGSHMLELMGTIGGAPYAGTSSHCAIWDGTVLTETQARAAIRIWRGMVSGSGNLISTTSATPPALMLAPPSSGTEPFLVDVGANGNQLANNGYCSGLYGASAVTNKAWRGSFETWAAGAPTGWTETITSTGDCAQTTAHSAKGASAASCANADNDDEVSLTSGCATVTGATLYRLKAYAMSISGTPSVTIDVIEDDSADCGSPTTTTHVITAAAPGATWTNIGDTSAAPKTITTQAGTIRAQVKITLPAGAAQTTLVDAVQLWAAATTSDQACTSDADADAVCTTMIDYDNSPYSANGPMTTTLTACSPWAGTDLAGDSYILYDGPASGANRYIWSIIPATDEPAFTVIDGASGAKYLAYNVSNWSALTQYIIKMGINGSGNLRLWWNNAWQTTPAGAGTGMRSAAQSYTYLSGSNTSGTDIYVKDIVVYRRVIP